MEEEKTNKVENENSEKEKVKFTQKLKNCFSDAKEKLVNYKDKIKQNIELKKSKKEKSKEEKQNKKSKEIKQESKEINLGDEDLVYKKMQPSLDDLDDIEEKVEEEKEQIKESLNKIENKENIEKNTDKTNDSKIEDKKQDEKAEKPCFGPERLEKIIANWFDSNKIFSIIVSIIAGILVHITFLTEMLLSQDGIWNSLGHILPTSWELCLGRWGIMLSDYLVNNLSIPNLTGVVSILLVSLATLIIIDTLEIKSKFSVFLISIAMMVSPALAATLIYVYTSVAYCVALLLGILSVRLMFTKRYVIVSRILSIILVCCTLGIYQSYIGVIVGFALITLISRLLKRDEKFLEVLLRGIVVLAIIILGGLLYMKVTNTILDKMSLGIADYNGASNISIENSIKNLDKTIPNAYNDFNRFYFEDDMVTNSNFAREKIWQFAFALTILLAICSLFVKKMWKKPWKILLLVIFMILIPLGMSSVDMLVTDYSLYIVTSMQFILIVPLMMLFVEETENKFLCIFRLALIINIFIVLYTYFMAISASYSAMKMTYNQAIEVTNRILTRIELEETFSIDKPVMIAGYILDDSEEYSKRSDIYDYTLNLLFTSPVVHGSYYGMQGTWMKFINVYLGTRVVYCSTQDYINIVNSEEFKQMPCYPAQGSVKNVNGVLVVKLRNDPPMP